MAPRGKKRFVKTFLLRGFSSLHLLILVVLPLTALMVKALSGGLREIWTSIMQPEALYSVWLSFGLAIAMVLLNTVTGTATAWVMVRYEFPGKALLNAVIDLPFAIPTLVTGLMLAVLYGPQSAIGHFFSVHGVEIIYAKPGIVLALLMVTFPFVVRAVQPVLMAMDEEMEEAAATLGASPWVVFRSVTVPSILPAIFTGAAQSFSRALGEFGSVIMVAGNIPMRTQVAAVYIYGEIESYNPVGAIGVSVVLLLGSILTLLCLRALQHWGRKDRD